MPLMTTEEMNAQTGWTPKQRNHLRRLIRQGATIAYVNTDASGLPCNGGSLEPHFRARPGAIQILVGGAALKLCGPAALHGTFEPHRWSGARVWIAGFVGQVLTEHGKIGALRREIVGEVLPECSLSHSVGVRLGRKDLSGANLEGANLRGADLRGANLWGADLRGANLWDADLGDADLEGANLRGADLRGANLWDANLRGANLRGADLRGANLWDADLGDADLTSVWHDAHTRWPEGFVCPSR